MLAALYEFFDTIEHLYTIWDYTVTRASFSKEEDTISSAKEPQKA